MPNQCTAEFAEFLVAMNPGGSAVDEHFGVPVNLQMHVSN